MTTSKGCIVCGEPNGIAIGGCLFCKLHATAYREWALAEIEAGRPTDAARWALGERKVLATNIRLPAAVMEAADRLARDRGISRNRLIQALIEHAAAREKQAD